MACAICEVRRPRRFCPGVRGDICSTCCGTEREATVDCPLDCEYLREARKHERPVPLDGLEIPNREIEVTERLLRENDGLLSRAAAALFVSAMETPGVADADIRETLDALVRTFRTLGSGVYYETRPVNPLAAAVYEAVQAAIAAYREEERQQLGMTRTRDAGVLGVLVFLQRVELDRNNGRRRGRAFLDSIGRVYGARPEDADLPGSPLVLP
jgi:hypothetical protein